VTEARLVVKVQVPLDAPGPVLVYNEDRSVQQLFDKPGELGGAMLKLEGKPKGFFYAHVTHAGGQRGLILDEPAPWQTW